MEKLITYIEKVIPQVPIDVGVISKVFQKENLAKDIDILPIWMKKIIKPMLNN